MKKHQGLEALEVIERIGGAIVELGLRHSKPQRDGLAHDMGGERWFCIELHLEGSDGSDLEGLKLVAHIVDLADKIGFSLFSRRERLVKIGGLYSESWAGRATVLRIFVALRVSWYWDDRRWR